MNHRSERRVFSLDQVLSPSAATTRAVLIVTVALLYGLLAYVEIVLTRGTGRLAALWLPNALVVAVILRGQEQKFGAWFLACSLANFVANIAVGDTLWVAAGLTFANILEIVLVCWSMRRWCGVDIDISDGRQLATFSIAAGILAPATSGLLAATVIGLPEPGLRAEMWTSWWMTDALGLLVATPPLMLLGNRKASVLQGARNKLFEFALVMALTAISSIVVFSQHNYPLLFILPPFVILSAFRFGPSGTALTIILIAVISLTGTWRGTGPLALVHGDDHTKLILLQLFLATNVGMGVPIAAALVTRDRIRSQLAESRDNLTSILESIAELVFRLDANGHLIFVNSAFERVLKIPAGEAIGRSALSFVDPGEVAAGAAYLAAIATGDVTGTKTIWRLIDGQGNVRTVKGNIRRLIDQNGRYLGVTGCLRDVTEKYAAEAKLKQAQAELFHMSRLSAMGVMAATLAHELNQPLAGVTNYARGLRLQATSKHWAAPEPVMMALHEIDAGASRAGEIVRRLRDLVERNEVDRKLEPLSELIHEACVIPLIDARSLGIRYFLDLDPHAKTVFADRIQIQQVLMNLLRNAVEALDGQPQRDIRISTRLSRGTCEIGVHDSGPGVSESVLTRLFSSFNTTKSSGMGIGLSICRTIVEANGGQIWYEPGVPGGATFRITLPCSEIRAEAA